MKLFKFFTLLILALLIFGSAGYFAYELFLKPTQTQKKEEAIAALPTPIPTPTPDPGLPEFQRLKALQDSGKIAEAQAGLAAWVTNNQLSPLLPEARQRLGSVNMALLFQSDGTNAISYTVVKGDSLARIASQHESNAELIQKANSLPSVNIRIGEQLVIPSLKISIVIDRTAKTLTLFNNGLFLKEYTLLSAPSSSKSEDLTSKISDKLAIVGTKRVAFGDKTYAQSERTIMLAQAPAIIGSTTSDPITPVMQGSTTPPTATRPPTPLPRCFVLLAHDLLEIYPLVSRNTPVMIH